MTDVASGPDVALNVVLDAEQAMALAQFLKRVSRETIKVHAGDAAEADAIFWALRVVRVGLIECGFHPR